MGRVSRTLRSYGVLSVIPLDKGQKMVLIHKRVFGDARGGMLNITLSVGLGFRM